MLSKQKKLGLALLVSTLTISILSLPFLLPGQRDFIQTIPNQVDSTSLRRLVSIEEDEEEMFHIDMDHAFQIYCSQYSKTYANKGEYEKRKAIFVENIRFIQDYNEEIRGKIEDSGGELTVDDFAQMGINEMIDWTEEERTG